MLLRLGEETSAASRGTLDPYDGAKLRARETVARQRSMLQLARVTISAVSPPEDARAPRADVEGERCCARRAAC